MSDKQKLYIFLSSIFCSIVISGNLIFQKFVKIDLFYFELNLSAGVIFYPFIFLISDFVTEIYGANYSRLISRCAMFCSILIILLLKIADFFQSSSWSRVDDETFLLVFGVYDISVIISIIAAYLGQVSNIFIYNYLKKIHHGNYIWIRSNISTLFGQALDSFVIVSGLVLFVIIPVSQMSDVIVSSLIFKIITTLVAAPILYLMIYIYNKIGVK